MAIALQYYFSWKLIGWIRIEWLVGMISDALSMNHQQACIDSINFPLQSRLRCSAFITLKKKRQ
jgi:hypothetical protein